MRVINALLSIVSYNVVITSVLNPDDKQIQSVEDGHEVIFDNLQPDTEYQVSEIYPNFKLIFKQLNVEGVADEEPNTAQSFSHVRTKRQYIPYQSRSRTVVPPTQKPPQPAYSSQRTYTSRLPASAHVDAGKYNPDATIITECKRIDQTDLVILIDGSWSVTPDNFVRVQTFLGVLLKHFTIGDDATLIGIAQYSDTPQLEFGLHDYKTFDKLLPAINRMKYKGGNTAAGKALTFALEQVFGRRSRPNAQKVVLVITDGESLQDSVTEPARRLRENGVEIFSIGVGDEINLLELQDMATDPDQSHVFQVGGYNAISGITSVVLKDICRIKVICPELLTPAHGSKHCSKEQAIVGVVCNFECDQGYDLRGSAERECQQEGGWTGIQPQCERSTCPELSAPLHGRLSCTDGIRIGSQCTTTCQHGYRINGNAHTTCQLNERWSSDLPRCELVKCPALNVHLSPHLRMECSEGNLFRSTCNFICDVGWELRGNDQIECQAGGEWDGNIPYCQCKKTLTFCILFIFKFQ